jgi:exodeoxyribonuclease VII large subunit
MTTTESPIAAREAGSNLPEYSVGELSQAVKRTVEGAFGLVRVRGEVSRPSIPSSGHCYLRLKDETAVLDAVIWKGTLARLGLRPEEGMDVVCVGRLTTYPGKSTYQLVVERVELAGVGALLKMIEDRRKRLAAEGLFDASRKRPLPFLPSVIGIVTSPTGAVIRDILHRLAERFPRHVLVWPVAVQGEGAPAQVAAAIEGFNRMAPGGAPPRPDLLIVARGGGSLEDLMAFNEEIVVRAAAASEIALISAIGHETDTTLIDFAADWRAPTPTAAAERAVPVRADLIADLARDARRLVAAMIRQGEERRLALANLARALGDPRRLVEERQQRLDDWSERLPLSLNAGLARRRARLVETAARLLHPREALARARLALAERAGRLAASHRAIARGAEDSRARIGELSQRLALAASRHVEDSRRRLASAAALLESYSFQRVLERGFVLVRDREGRPVTAARDTTAGDALALRFHDGAVDVQVVGGKTATKPGAKAKPGQGSLF